MALGMEIGLGPGHIVLDGEPAPPPKKEAQPPIFGPFLLWSNGWMHQSLLGMEVGLGPGHIVLGGDPASSPKGAQPLPVFSTCLLSPNSWMN